MTQDRGTMPTTKKIHDYWYKQVTENQDELLKLIGDNAVVNILIGKGEECYACGHNTRLQKCHIVPHGCGGDENVENLFMMCLRCHQDNPDTVYADLFYKYVREKESYLNSTMDAIYPYITNSAAELSDEERAKFDAFCDLTSKQQAAHHKKIKFRNICTGMNNRMSFNTLLGAIWKNILHNDFTPKLKRGRHQPSLVPA